jgi:hypothetical protein
MERPLFQELADFIRTWAQLPIDQPIGPDTQFERDLGITGDDGGYLLREIETHFAVQLSTKEDGYRKTFDLKENEYLFNGEGFPLWELLPFVPRSTVRTFTVGELHEAIMAAVRRSGSAGER